MKTTTLLAALALTLAGTAFAAGGHDHSPKHGGVVAEAKDVDYELVAKPAAIQLHLRDHGKPVDVSKGQRQADLADRHREAGSRAEACRRQARGDRQLQGRTGNQGRCCCDRRRQASHRALCFEVNHGCYQTDWCFRSPGGWTAGRLCHAASA